MKLLFVIHLKVLQNAIFSLKHPNIIDEFKSSHLACNAWIANPREQQIGSRIEIRQNGLSV